MISGGVRGNPVHQSKIPRRSPYAPETYDSVVAQASTVMMNKRTVMITTMTNDKYKDKDKRL